MAMAVLRATVMAMVAIMGRCWVRRLELSWLSSRLRIGLQCDERLGAEK